VRVATERDPLRRHYRARLREPLDPDLAVFARVLVPRLRLQPARHPRARSRAGSAHARVWVVNQDGVNTVRPTSSTSSREPRPTTTSSRVRPTSSTTSTSPTTRQARGADPRHDASRHTAEADGHGSQRRAGHAQPHRGAAPLQALGLQRLGGTRSRRSSGSALPDALRNPRDRLPAQRRPRHRPPRRMSQRSATSSASKPARR